MTTATKKPIEHGTRTGYETHLKRGSKPCRRCLDARNATMRAYRERQRELAAERAAKLQAMLDERIPGGSRRWRDEAACIDTDPEAFYPPQGGGNKEATAEALDACAICPLWVKAECLADALAETKAIGGTYGIRAGLTPQERRAPAVRTQLPTSEEGRPCVRCGRPLFRRADEAAADFDRRVKCGRTCPLTDAQITEAKQHAAAGGTLAVLAKRWKILAPTARQQLDNAGCRDLTKAMDSNVGRSR